MSRKIKIYQTLTFAFMCLSIILLLIMGITAIQKSMELNVKFQVSPKYQCEILLGGNQIFCNTSENNKTPAFKSGASLSGNTLSLNETLTGELGATLNFTIYNYSNLDIKVSIKNTSDYVILDKYPSGTTTSKTLTTTNSTGLVEFVFEEIQYCTITFNSNDGTNTTKTQFIIQGETSTLISNTFTRDGYNFNGWNTSSDGSGTAYANASSIKSNVNMTLYAMWQPKVYTISYTGDSRPKSSNPSQAVHNQKLVLEFTGYSGGGGTWCFSSIECLKEVSVGGIKLNSNQYSASIKNAGDGDSVITVTIPAEYVTGNIVVKVDGDIWGLS